MQDIFANSISYKQDATREVFMQGKATERKRHFLREKQLQNLNIKCVVNVQHCFLKRSSPGILLVFFIYPCFNEKHIANFSDSWI